MKGIVKGLMYSGLKDCTTVEIELEGNQATDIEKYKGKHTDVCFKPYRKNRSLDANAYFWVLLGKLAATVGADKIDLYRQYIQHIGENNETVCVQDAAVEKLREGWEHNGLGWVTDIFPSKIKGCTNVILYYGSSTYNTKQMSDLIDLVIQDCKAVEVQTKTPTEINDMLNLWEMAK